MIQHTFSVIYKAAISAYCRLICPAIALKVTGLDEISVLIPWPLPASAETNRNHKVQSNSSGRQGINPMSSILTIWLLQNNVSRDSSVGIANSYQSVGVQVPVGSRIFLSRRSDRLWDPPNLLSNGYRGLFPRE
jgi:hypothetical protein